MHSEAENFVRQTKERFPVFFRKVKVLEVGSYNVNGSVRQFFEKPELYIGLDVASGKDVDVVCHGADYDTDVRFDTVISTECFEHDEWWYRTFTNMIRLCRPGGLVVFTCASNQRAEHGTLRSTPQDSAKATEYYMNLDVFDFENAADLPGLFSHYCFEARSDDLYFFGVRK